jgi:hypothetical protein
LKQKILNTIFLLLAFVLATICAFYLEESYRVLVRKIFKWSTNNNISFFGKNFHLFPSYQFVLSFGLYISFFIFLIKSLRIKKKLLVTIMVSSIFFISTFLFSYIESNLKIIECTACDNEKLKLHFNHINYDLIFISSLVISLIPLLILKIKNSRIRG